jgi:hypothetical protein
LKGKIMFGYLNRKIADRIVDRLDGTGAGGRARKAISTYRRHPSAVTKLAALRAIDLLDDNVQTDLRQAARI